MKICIFITFHALISPRNAIGLRVHPWQILHLVNSVRDTFEDNCCILLMLFIIIISYVKVLLDINTRQANTLY